MVNLLTITRGTALHLRCQALIYCNSSKTCRFKLKYGCKWDFISHLLLLTLSVTFSCYFIFKHNTVLTFCTAHWTFNFQTAEIHATMQPCSLLSVLDKTGCTLSTAFWIFHFESDSKLAKSNIKTMILK